MAANLRSGSFRIVSITEGNPPIGINYTMPAQQNVYVNGPVQSWVFKRVGDNTYRLSVGGYPYVGVDDGKVIASIYPEQELEWEVTYSEYQGAYTIALVNDPSVGWTIPANLSEGRDIEIKPIIPIPQQFLPRQLFRFVPLDE